MADVRGDENKKNVEIFRSFTRSDQGPSSRCLYFHFLETPIKINGSSRVTSINLAKNCLIGDKFEQIAIVGTDSFELKCSLIFRSVGYRGVPLPGVNFDHNSGTIPNAKGRCLRDERPERGLYVTGWIKRGPSGLIGTNRADSVETVESLFEDLATLDPVPKSGARAIASLSGGRLKIVSYADWQEIDISERNRGHQRGKPREKFTCISDMLAVLGDGVSEPIVPF